MRCPFSQVAKKLNFGAMSIFDRDLLRNRGPTSDFVRGYLLLVSDLAAWWRSAFAVKLRLDPT